MISIRITEDSIANLRLRFEQAGVQVQESVARQMAEEMAELNSIVKAEYLSGQYLKRRTGNLSRSGMSHVEQSPSLIQGDVTFGAEAPYGRMLSEGTRPHVIQPVRARALAFQMDGRMIFRRLVHHPGTTPKPFLTDAFIAQKPEIIVGLQTAVTEAVAELG